MDRQMDRQMVGQTDGRTDLQMDEKMGWWVGGQTETYTLYVYIVHCTCVVGQIDNHTV